MARNMQNSPPAAGAAPAAAADSAAGQGGSGKGFVIALLAVTLLAAGAGAGMGFLLGPKLAAAQAGEQQQAQQQEVQEDEPRPIYSGRHLALRLQPITTNLRAPQRSWVRLEGALLVNAQDLDEKAQAELALLVQQDVLAHLRTLSLRDLEGPGNLAFLRDDLSERARTRSDGRVEEFVILSLVVE